MAGLVEITMGQVLETGAEIWAGFRKYVAELRSSGQTVNALGGCRGLHGEKKTKGKRKLCGINESWQKSCLLCIHLKIVIFA